MFYDITYTEFMTSDLLSVTSYPLFRTSHHFMYVIKSHCICPHVHCICDITPNLSMTSQQLHGRYYRQCICDNISPMFLTKYPLCMTSHTIRVHHIQYACYHNCLGHYTPLWITSHPVYLWHHIQYVRYHRTAFMKTQRLYRTSHPPYLTSHPLYLCHYTDGKHLCINVSLYWWNHNKCVSHHTWHTYNTIPNLHPITFTLYDINDHVLWYHIHGIHDIRSSLCDIISTL